MVPKKHMPVSGKKFPLTVIEYYTKLSIQAAFDGKAINLKRQL
jgi:hypothetical protein